jgi:hypothetical protein
VGRESSASISWSVFGIDAMFKLNGYLRQPELVRDFDARRLLYPAQPRGEFS